MINAIQLRNLLSFGPETPPLPLQPLNVLIGPNGSGKSNLIEAISLLRSAPTDLASPVRKGGGIRDWLWKGAQEPIASVDVEVEYASDAEPLRHVIEFTEIAQRFCLSDERIEQAIQSEGQTEAQFYLYRNGRPQIASQVKRGDPRLLVWCDPMAPDQSILSQRKDPDSYPEITYLGQCYSRIRIYREWAFGRDTVPRRPQAADQPNDHLGEDFQNLGLVLNRLRGEPKVKDHILDSLNQLYPGISDFHVKIEGGTVQVFFHESGFAIPATRLSDGTLRYLCLLAILCHPAPPPLICIEEPELGLHPDILPTIAGLLKEASERTQLVVTTHSDILVDEMTEQPESVVVCEKADGCTSTRRLDREQLAHWLEKYRLGELWTRGELGGNRW